MIRSLPLPVLTQLLLTTSPQAAPPTEPPAAYTRKSFSDTWWISVDLYIDLLWSGLLVFRQRYGKHAVFELGVSPGSVNVQGNAKAAHEFTTMPLDAMIVLTVRRLFNLVNASTRAPFQSTFCQKSSGFLASIWLIFPCSQDLTALSILRSLPSISSSSIVLPASFKGMK